jgi:hypothetical protein
VSEARMGKGNAVGVSDAAQDNIVPFVVLFQKTSPQVDRGDDRYVEGAEFGHIWVRGHPETEVVPGDQGIDFQPCYVDHVWVRWRSRGKGGGVTARYPLNDDPRNFDQPPADLGVKRGPNPDNPQTEAWVFQDGSGDTLVETRYLSGYILDWQFPLPYVISLTSTGHTFYKKLNAMLRNLRFPNGNRINIWDRHFRLTSRRATNPKGTYAVWEFRDLGFTSDEQAEMGEHLHQSLASGSMKVADEAAVAEAAGTDKDIPF